MLPAITVVKTVVVVDDAIIGHRYICTGLFEILEIFLNVPFERLEKRIKYKIPIPNWEYFYFLS